jgi:hypothetical protein
MKVNPAHIDILYVDLQQTGFFFLCHEMFHFRQLSGCGLLL